MPLANLQQQFVDLRFGMFIHFNIPTYMNQDWPDPDASPSLFNPTKLNCDQWAKAAKSANMSYGCLTTKHHSGFCIWDTKTTDYNVMNSPLKRDVVKEFTDAFRANGLKVMLYYSILDTHHRLRPNSITRKHIEMVKAQLTELLSNYGEISALIIDGWDAPWSRISYDDIPFEDIYLLVKKLQPNCVLMDLNGAKYPPEGLYYTDIKTYEMGAGQRVGKESTLMPALACLPLQANWFWKTSFPDQPVKDPVKLVNETLIPLNKVDCNFILNVAPNKDGLIDDNALAALKKIGEIWHNEGPVTPSCRNRMRRSFRQTSPKSKHQAQAGVMMTTLWTWLTTMILSKPHGCQTRQSQTPGTKLISTVKKVYQLHQHCRRKTKHYQIPAGVFYKRRMENSI